MMAWFTSSTTRTSNRRNDTPYPMLLAVLLLLAFWLQAAGNLSEQSPVVDEPTHIARAQAYWRNGDLRLQRGHLPLAHILSGLALQLEPGLPSPADLPGWANSDRMSMAKHLLWAPGRPAERMIFLARLPILMLATVLGAVLFRWGNQRLGKRAALIALVLFAMDPNLLAHSVLITTDMSVTVFFFITAYLLDRWSLRPNWRYTIATGLAAGLAMTSKLSAAVLGPVIVIIVAITAWRRRTRPGAPEQGIAPIIGMLGIMGLAAALVIAAIYRFEFGPVQSGGIAVPLPSFWRSLLTLEAHNEAGHQAFLFGQISPKGWWYYFIVAFALKTPLPTLILLVTSLLLAWLGPMSKQGHKDGLAPVWLISLGLYSLASLRIAINVGYRHILPCLPFVILIAASCGWRAASRELRAVSHRLRIAHDELRVAGFRFQVSHVALYALLLWNLINAIRIYPHHLAYFNEAVGGPDRGYQALVDSNLDWGQDVKRLKDYLEAHAITQPYLTLFAGSLPEYYGIQTRPLPGPYQPPTAYDFHRIQPAPGVYVIGASNLQGLRLDDPDTFDTFRRQKPLAQVGHSLFVYKVDSRPAVERWVAVCHTIDGPMDGEGIDQAFGHGDLRKLFYSCADGWIYPAGGAPGWYIIPQREGRLEKAETFLMGAPEVFSERGYIEQEAYRVYRFEGYQALEAHLGQLNRPAQNVRIGPATFLGYSLDTPSAALQRGQVAHLTTYWRAEQSDQALLSILAHLGGPAGLVATGDGLSAPAETWQVGDIIAQVHSLNIPPDTPPGDYTFYVGLYSLGSGQRLPISLDGQPASEDRLPIATLHVSP